jgi:hypothetical protein
MRYENRFGFDTDYTQEGRFNTQEEKPNQTTTNLPSQSAIDAEIARRQQRNR